MRSLINTVLIGAFAALSSAISLESVAKAIEEKFKSKSSEVAKLNVLAMQQAYEFVKKRNSL